VHRSGVAVGGELALVHHDFRAVNDHPLVDRALMSSFELLLVKKKN
jgi:hypothetical protein